MAADTRTGALPGFRVLLETELLDARRSKRLIAFVAIMTLFVALIPIIAYVNADNYSNSGRHLLDENATDGLIGTWAGLVGYLGAMMVIAATVDAVTHDRSLGVTAWIITKPVSRLSYLTAKAAAQAIVACATVVIIPSLVWFGLTILLFQGVSTPAIGGAVLILCIEMTFLSFTVIALGVAFRSVAPIAILSLALWFLPALLPVLARQEWLFNVLPSYLPFAAITAGLSARETITVSLPIASVIIAAMVFAAAVISFERQEL